MRLSKDVNAFFPTSSSSFVDGVFPLEEEEEEDSVIAVVIVPIPVEVGEGEELPEAAVGLEIAEATIALVAVAGMANAVEAEEGTLEEAQVVEEWMDRLPVENALV
mmetsp:Transcript_12669/g.26822  ORF Transcript_12669/g.26822 Transcript_12669/m.26822 type:complete len:106 (+) Transcript_12669:1581-1898(+)